MRSGNEQSTCNGHNSPAIHDQGRDVVAFKMGRRRDPSWPIFEAFSQRVAR
jgi:hypothetical protein